MENAAKALLIAGGILIAVIIISVALFAYLQAKELKAIEEKEIKIEQVSEFNNVYLSYDKKALRGVELITLINKAIDNNTKDNGNHITIEVTIRESSDGLTAGKHIFTDGDRNAYKGVLDNPEYFKYFKEKRFFDCISNKTEYKNRSGIISKMVFQEIKLENNIGEPAYFER